MLLYLIYGAVFYLSLMCLNIPEGYEDESGFHFGKEDDEHSTELEN